MDTGNVAIIGMQWGDEGKGKIVDCYCSDFELIVRFQGGANAGHTVVVEGEKFVFHLLPSGVLNPACVNVIGNGVVVDLAQLCAEIDEVEERAEAIGNRLKISDRAAVVLPYHKARDAAGEKKSKNIGTTLRGIGPAYSDKIARRGLRFCDLLDDAVLETKITELCEFNNRVLAGVYDEDGVDAAAVVAETAQLAARIRPYVTDTVAFLHESLEAGKRILFEGAQGSMLDIDFGTYPYVTSSSTMSGGISTGCGVPPRAVDQVVGVVKAYATRVGEGPFPTELEDEVGEGLRDAGGEYGATTGRPRRCGWIDMVALKHAIRINGTQAVALTKLDVLDATEEIKVCTAYEYEGKTLTDFPADAAMAAQCSPVYESVPGWCTSSEGSTSFDQLPQKAQEYIAYLEGIMGIPCSIISTGQGREAVIFK